jgi:hypothetical protein
MQAAHHFRFYDGAIRTKIGEGLRTLFVPTEPPPKRLLALLNALDQPNRAPSATEDAVCKKLPRARRTRRRFAGQKRDKVRAGSILKPPAEDAPARANMVVNKKRRAHAKHRSNISEKERIEEIPCGYVVSDANGQPVVYVYRGANEFEALQANVLTIDEALRIAINIAKLREA